MADLGPMIIFRTGVPTPVAVPVVSSVTVLGKHPGCDVVLANPFVSRHHARIDLVDGAATIRDLSSKNGTYVNGIKIGTEPSELLDGAVIEFGKNQVTAEFQLVQHTLTLDSLQAPQQDPGQTQFVIDQQSRQVWVNGEVLLPPLTRKEFDILLLLNSKQGQVCSHQEIARGGWPEREGSMVDETEIRQYIRRIRARFDSVTATDVGIVTLRGIGYRLDIG
jgi:pSer/pThr/pTyr-binding forkhead associated (FHA) protein